MLQFSTISDELCGSILSIVMALQKIAYCTRMLLTKKKQINDSKKNEKDLCFMFQNIR